MAAAQTIATAMFHDLKRLFLLDVRLKLRGLCSQCVSQSLRGARPGTLNA